MSMERVAGRNESAPLGYVLLEDGMRFDGELRGATEAAGTTGEVVFNTSMTGYQESVTDPSYAGQIITFTYPLIGNYGVSAAAMESDRIHARAVIMRQAKNSEDAADAEGGWVDWLRDCGIVGIDGVDTRALVRHIRDRGAMRGGIFPAELAEAEARARVEAEPPMDGADLARTVTPAEPVEFDGDGPHVVGIDTGIKLSIIRQFRERNCRLTLLPCTASAEDVLERDPDMVFLANGPGDPAALGYVVETVRDLVGKRPVVGICLGHQLLCRAVGLETFKLPFGHRGANHPVKDLATGKIEITSQNHGFAVQGPGGEQRMEADEPVRWETEFGAAELSHLNLYDRTVEGLVLRDVPGATVQYHPEAGPGPHDARYLFDRFLELTSAKRHMPVAAPDGTAPTEPA
jgi:carbamoyl-phosphate synthase small subunit